MGQLAILDVSRPHIEVGGMAPGQTRHVQALHCAIVQIESIQMKTNVMSKNCSSKQHYYGYKS